MARSARQTAEILSELYDETFASDSCEKFRITWQDLRGIAGVQKLAPGYLRQVNRVLNESGYNLIPLDNFLAVAQESDLKSFRLVPPRIVDQYLFEDGDDGDDADDIEVHDFEEDEDSEPGDYGPEDIELDDDEVENAIAQ